MSCIGLENVRLEGFSDTLKFNAPLAAVEDYKGKKRSRLEIRVRCTIYSVYLFYNALKYDRPNITFLSAFLLYFGLYSQAGKDFYRRSVQLFQAR